MAKNKSSNFSAAIVRLSSAGSGSKSTGWQGFSPSGGLKFGKPASSTALQEVTQTSTGTLSSVQTASGEWASLMKKITGRSVSSFLGLGSLFGGIASLFGGGSSRTLPALQLFELNDSIDQTVQVQTRPMTRSTQTLDPAAVAKAVKTAMLTSSTLNDVISEL